VTLLVGGACGPSSEPQDASSAGNPGARSIAEYDLACDLFVNRRNAREGLQHALSAVELDGKNAEAAHLVSLIYLSFCATLEADCRLDEAERYARRALKAKSDLREAKNTLGLVLIHQGRYADAVGVLEPLTRDILYSTPENAWGNLGWAYLEKGDTNKAISSLKRALALQPGFCEGAYRLGLAYEKAGDHKAALEAMTRAVETDHARCRALQDAFLVRARIATRLGDNDMARSDLERCRDLDEGTPSGKLCVAELAKRR